MSGPSSLSGPRGPPRNEHKWFYEHTLPPSAVNSIELIATHFLGKSRNRFNEYRVACNFTRTYAIWRALGNTEVKWNVHWSAGDQHCNFWRIPSGRTLRRVSRWVGQKIDMLFCRPRRKRTCVLVDPGLVVARAFYHSGGYMCTSFAMV